MPALRPPSRDGCTMNQATIALLACVLWCCAGTLHAAATSTTDARESKGRQACVESPEQVADGDLAGQFFVVCAPHTTLAGQPALFVAECHDTAMHCQRALLAIRVPVGAGSALLVPRGASFARAREVAATLVDYPTHFNGRNLAQLLQGLCFVEDRGSGAFAGARDYLVRCGRRGVVVTRACVGEACRLFPARWEDEGQAAVATGVRIR